MVRYITILFLIGFTVSACKKQPESIQPTISRISESVYASGIIVSKNQYQVYSTVSGLIQKIWVQPGDLVKEGDVLFVIKNETSKINAENARLAADFADSNLQGDRLNELKNAIETAKSKMLNDSVLLIRQRGLWAQQIGSKVELEQRELTYTNSLSGYEAALLRYKDLQKQLKFNAKQSQKLLAISKTASQDYVIRSQTTGRVYSITKEEGEIVGIQSPVAIIGDADAFVAELQIDEYDISRIKPGQRVLLSLDSYKGQAYEAVVTKIDPFMNDRSRTFTVEADFTKRPPVLYPNLTAEANIVILSKENVITIPRSFMVNDSIVLLSNKEKRKVTIGLKDYQKVEIRSGLQAGETILKPAE